MWTNETFQSSLKTILERVKQEYIGMNITVNVCSITPYMCVSIDFFNERTQLEVQTESTLSRKLKKTING